MDSTNSVAVSSSVTQKHKGQDGRSGALVEPKAESPLNFLDLSRDILELILDEVAFPAEPTCQVYANAMLTRLSISRFHKPTTSQPWPAPTLRSTISRCPASIRVRHCLAPRPGGTHRV